RTGQNQIEPLFPGYLFARFDVATHLLTLRRLQGFQALLCFDGNPACVEPEIIEDLRRRERGRGYINLHVPTKQFAVNAPVRVLEGAFSGRTGLFLRHVDSTDRVSILLDIWRTSVRLELPIHAVVPVPSHETSHHL